MECLTHWGRVTHICVGKPTNIGSDNGLSPGRRQAIIWTNAGILLFGPIGTHFSEYLVVIHTFSFNIMHLKMSSAKWRSFCLGLNVLNVRWYMGINRFAMRSLSSNGFLSRYSKFAGVLVNFVWKVDCWIHLGHCYSTAIIRTDRSWLKIKMKKRMI